MKKDRTETLIRIKEDIKPDYDVVNKPRHYNLGKYEVIDVIEDMLSYNNNYKGADAYYIGNVIKYIFRAGLKGNANEDLQKARFYLNKIIED